MAPPSTSNNIPLVILARSTVTTPDTSRTPMTSGAAPGLSDGRCKWRFSLQILRCRHPVGEGDSEGVQGRLPARDPSCLWGRWWLYSWTHAGRAASRADSEL